MALLFVGGVMNVLWIAVITFFVLMEKVVPAGRFISRVSGVGFLAAGVWLIAQESRKPGDNVALITYRIFRSAPGCWLDVRSGDEECGAW